MGLSLTQIVNAHYFHEAIFRKLFIFINNLYEKTGFKFALRGAGYYIYEIDDFIKSRSDLDVPRY